MRRLGRHAGVALDQAVLHFDRAAHSVDHAAELDDDAVAGALDDAAVMRGDGGSMRSLRSARSRASVRSSSAPGEPAIAGDVGDQDRCEFPGLAHSSGIPALRRPSKSRSL